LAAVESLFLLSDLESDFESDFDSDLESDELPEPSEPLPSWLSFSRARLRVP
jgi:hypothetical protein